MSATTTSIGRDAEKLAALGYKQEFRRAFTPLEVFSLSFTILGIFPSIACVLFSRSRPIDACTLDADACN